MREKQILARAIEIQETDLNLHTVHSKFGCSQKSSKQGSLYTIDPRTLSCEKGFWPTEYMSKGHQTCVFYGTLSGNNVLWWANIH